MDHRVMQSRQSPANLHPAARYFSDWVAARWLYEWAAARYYLDWAVASQFITLGGYSLAI